MTISNSNDKQHRSLLQRIARRAMVERGLLPDFSPQALAELDDLRGTATQTDKTTRDLRHLLWCFIDNDDSRDLDQLTVAEAMPDKIVKVLVAVADVDSLVKKDSAIDEHARRNTTSVYTAARLLTSERIVGVIVPMVVSGGQGNLSGLGELLSDAKRQRLLLHSGRRNITLFRS